MFLFCRHFQYAGNSSTQIFTFLDWNVHRGSCTTTVFVLQIWTQTREFDICDIIRASAYIMESDVCMSLSIKGLCLACVHHFLGSDENKGIDNSHVWKWSFPWGTLLFLQSVSNVEVDDIPSCCECCVNVRAWMFVLRAFPAAQRSGACIGELSWCCPQLLLLCRWRHWHHGLLTVKSEKWECEVQS